MDVATMFDIFVSYGFETDDELTEDRKLEALNETYWDACERNDWTFLESSVTLTFAGGSATPSNDPGDIAQVITASRTTGGALEPWRADDFYEYYGSQLTQAGSPLIYYFEANQLKCYPVPGASDAVLLKYISVADELTLTSSEADIRFPKRYHRSVLVMGTLSKLAVMQDDTDLGASYERLYEKALSLMTTANMKNQSQRTEFIHINDPDNWDYS
jgi:hypothetical protein